MLGDQHNKPGKGKSNKKNKLRKCTTELVVESQKLKHRYMAQQKDIIR